MSQLGFNANAQFCSPQPLGLDQGPVQDASRRPQGGALDNSGQNGHEHHWRLWQPKDRKDLRFFEGNIREMQSVVMTPGSNMVVQRFGIDAKNYYVDNRQVATVTYSGGTYTIHALGAGKAVLHAENSKGKCASALFIHVRRMVTVPVMFLFLKDSSEYDVTGHWEQRAEIIRAINEIYLPQLALSVVDKTPESLRKQPVVIDLDLGNPVNLSLFGSGTVQGKVLRAMPIAAQGPFPKFIFVRNFNDPDTRGLQRSNQLFICDGVGPKKIGRVCAHELAHFLTDQITDEFDQEGHTTERGHLLNSVADGIRLDPFSFSYAMYRRALAAGGELS